MLIIFDGMAVGGADFRARSLLVNEVSSVRMFSEFVFIPPRDPQSDEIFLPDVFKPIADELAELML